MPVSSAESILAERISPDSARFVYRAQQWLFSQLYLTGRQTERRNLMKEPPSPMTSSSSEADSSAPGRYVRWAPWTPVSKDLVNPKAADPCVDRVWGLSWGWLCLPPHGSKDQCYNTICGKIGLSLTE